MATRPLDKWTLRLAIPASLVAIITLVTYFGGKDFKCSVASLFGFESSLCVQQPSYINVNFIVQTKELKPIPGAKVVFVFKGAPEPRYTDINGYVKNNIPFREYVEVTISKEGYQPLPITLNLYPKRDDTPFTYQLEKESSSLPPSPSPSPSKSNLPTPNQISSTSSSPEGNSRFRAIIKLDKDVFEEGEPIRVEYSGLPGRYRDWITLIDASKPDKAYGQRFYINKSGLVEFDGMSPGEYEIRAVYNYKSGNYNRVIGRHSLTVK